MKVFAVFVCLFAAAVLPVRSEERSSEMNDSVKTQRRLWKWSTAALIAGTALDAASSMNRPEANPLLRSSNGQFGYRALLLKTALASGTIAFELHFARDARGWKRFAIFNFIQAGGYAGLAVRNHMQ